LPETEEVSISLEAVPVVQELAESADVLALGPGISTNQDTVSFVRALLTAAEKPIVIDADGLNALAGAEKLAASCKTMPVLTPHPGEMARLLGIRTEQVQNNRIEVTLEAARKYNSVVLLKGNRTVVGSPDGTIYINLTGNPGMATGGLLGQGLPPLAAAAAGAYFHGLAGDLAVAEKGMLSMTAGDLLDYLPQATKSFC